MQYFGFNKQVLVQTTEKEMFCTVDPKQFCTLFFVVININDDNLLKKNLEQYVYKQF